MTLLDSLKNAIHKNNNKQQASPSKTKELPKIPPQSHPHHPAAGFAPDSAQDAHYAAFQPAPGTKSMQGEFVTANIANPTQQNLNAQAKVNYAANTGGLTAASTSAPSQDNRERAERSGFQTCRVKDKNADSYVDNFQWSNKKRCCAIDCPSTKVYLPLSNS
jgi:hypothetical protein